jgi:DNA-binding transcriptional MerR regulator/effector-binding domain-containing protein
MKTLYGIGEFSQVTGLSVKTLRFYHEKGILIPDSVDEATGYRSYSPSRIEKARVIMRLRHMEFSIEDIATVFAECADDSDILNHLERQKRLLQQRISEDRDIVRSLSQIIASEKEAKRLLEGTAFAVEEKSVEPMLIAGIRLRGKYSECGVVYSRLGKAMGRYICGKPLCLYYDGEYRDEDANLEPCFPIRKRVEAEGISVRELPGARCLALTHQGRYDQLGRSYARILEYADAKKTKIALPTREVYIKGPGVFFKGNPINYLTQILLPIGT